MFGQISHLSGGRSGDRALRQMLIQRRWKFVIGRFLGAASRIWKRTMGMTMFRNVFTCVAIMSLTAMMNPPGALAAPDPAPAVDEVPEIIVTAERRKERLQDVPIVVNALAGDQLEDAGVKSTVDLGAVTPG